ncbi:hypothetical protein BCR34DRAFT_602465 [Clohesyomyces aquaticus]|uniref:Uncharacterized protein n=1 Tax=Clohesyomyces aquaticus TaxID=1231657 RepID=A0A1Y1ZJK1_9PLEO|nr:hypothetical protein BCR34DRAFT_602465 [Clohesyomyces aquaticus]
MIDLFVDRGATLEVADDFFKHEGAIHLAVARDNIAVLPIFRSLVQQKFPSIQLDTMLPDLLQLALSVKARNATKWLIVFGATKSWKSEVCLSTFNKVRQYYSYQPLETTILNDWVEEAAMILKSRILVMYPTHLSDI